MAKFDKFKAQLLVEGRALVSSTFKAGAGEARTIFEDHLKDSEEKLKRWTRLLAEGQLDKDEFKILIKSQVTLGKMRLRVVSVIGKKSTMVFRERLRKLIIDTAFSVFL